VCYSAALPVERDREVLKRDSEDHTETVTVTLPKPTTIYSAPPSYATLTKSYGDDTIEYCSGDGSSVTIDGISDWICLDWGSLTFGVNKKKRQIWLDPFTTTDYASAPTSDGWNEGELTSIITETEKLVTTTHHNGIDGKHNFQCQPGYHPLSRAPDLRQTPDFLGHSRTR
jgi:hypothetical protein